MALRQLALQRQPQVLNFFLVDEQIGVSRQAELIAPQHFHSRKQFADMRVQNRTEEDEIVFSIRHLGR